MLSYKPSVPLESEPTSFQEPGSDNNVQEGAAASSCASRFFGLFTVAMRIHQVEGFEGYYKGTGPAIIFMFILIPLCKAVRAVFEAYFIQIPEVYYMTPTFPFSGLLEIQSPIGPLLLYIPALVITYRYASRALIPQNVVTFLHRAIAIPRLLPWNKPKENLRLLLTSAERRNPLLLYLTPGLLAAQLVHASFILLLPRIIGYLEMNLPKPTSIILGITVGMLLIIPTAPLQVIITRLAVQRDYGPDGDGVLEATPEVSDKDEKGDIESSGRVDVEPYFSGVVRTRADPDQYTGFLDCVQRMYTEEGWSVFYRLWWLAPLWMLF
ncbi:hypothetical protein HGRIS_004531 [Hohenbuehelia grisea]|uniref:Mitochondrial carrier n=1 Tax=Hohenbuehelia grisea TaxID=104357 RepID=A0ABR3JC55_9AGAR